MIDEVNDRVSDTSNYKPFNLFQHALKIVCVTTMNIDLEALAFLLSSMNSIGSKLTVATRQWMPASSYFLSSQSKALNDRCEGRFGWTSVACVNKPC